MAVAMIYGVPGSGKTVNSTLVKGKKLLLCSDNSAVVLKHFERDELEIKEVPDFRTFLDCFENATTEHKYDTIIVDNLTDLIDAYIVEARESGKVPDIRQAYMAVYTKVKALVRKARFCESNVIFTAWEDADQTYDSEGKAINRVSPMLPSKIKQQVCGLCNIIARVEKAKDKTGADRWFYRLDGNSTRMCKDQLMCRNTCLPEEIF